MSLKWGEFLAGIEKAKKEKRKLFDMETVTRLIFCGAFNSMIEDDPDYMQMKPHLRYLRMYNEARKSMKSQAQLPKKSAKESIGVRDIDGSADLLLWRHDVNPVFRCKLYPVFKDRLKKELNFVDNTSISNTDWIPMIAQDGDAQIRLFRNWEAMFSGQNTLDLLSRRGYYGAVVGIVSGKSEFNLKDGRVALKVQIFDGYGEYEAVMWPPKSESGEITTYDKGKAMFITRGSIGVFMVTPKIYQGRYTGNLAGFRALSDND